MPTSLHESSYVQSLLTRLELLQASKETASNPTSFAVLPDHHNDSFENERPVNPVASAAPQIEAIAISKKDTTSFDKHFYVPGAASSSRFFGSSSVFVLSVEVIHFAVRTGILPEDKAFSPSLPPPSVVSQDFEIHSLSFEHPETIRSYCTQFFQSSNYMYGIVYETTMEHHDMPFYLSQRVNYPVRSEELHGMEAHQYFRVGMACAIGCAIKSRYRPDLAFKSLAFYEDVLPYVEEVTSEASSQSLQALLLLTVFCLFWPGKGDIWKLLDYCCRLSVELGYHTEQSGDLEDTAQQKHRRSTFWGLYMIERIAGQIFGRSSDLTETIITTEYPHVPANFQPNAMAYNYRLVYLRSEIFTDVYMPAEPAEFSLDWYKERFWMLSSWRQEHDPSLIEAGTIAAVTCDVGLHSTTCFMFQPLMLRALKCTQTSPHTTDSFPPVPQDNYWSACALMELFESVMAVPEDSPLAAYPMTFFTAHYIYMCGLTIMSHAMLAIDGRIKTLKKMSELGDGYDTEAIDFSGLWSASNTCLVLLSWCSERWPGMHGMVDIYKALTSSVLPAMARKQLI